MTNGLTRENFEQGRLTSEQLSIYAGFSVFSARLSELPHWDIVRENSFGTDPNLFGRFNSQMQERANALFRRLEGAGLAAKGDVGESGKFTRKDAAGLATVLYPIVLSTSVSVKYPDEPFSHFRDVQKNGVDTVVDKIRQTFFGPTPGRVMPYVCQDVFNETLPLAEVRGVPQIFKKYASLLLVNGDSDDFRSTWAKELGLPVNRVGRLPDANIHHLTCELHERRHLIQINFDTSHDNTIRDPGYFKSGRAEQEAVFNRFIVRFYEEVDADMAAHSDLRRTPHGDRQKIDEALRMDRHKRYMGVLFNNPQYWFAPTIDALEQRRTAPSFYQVHQSVMEIRLRLLVEADKLERERNGRSPPEYVTSQELNLAVAGWRRYPGAVDFLPEQPKTITDIPLRSNSMIDYKPFAGPVQPGLDNKYMVWCDEQFFRRPEIFYTLMKKARGEGAFDANQLTGQIAKKVIEAAEYFDPTLTREPISRIRDSTLMLPRRPVVLTPT